MNVVRWGGGGANGSGILYTASSDRTVRVWDANGVIFASIFRLIRTLTTELRLGETTSHVERPCALGYNSDVKHRLRAAYRTL